MVTHTINALLLLYVWPQYSQVLSASLTSSAEADFLFLGAIFDALRRHSSGSVQWVEKSFGARAEDRVGCSLR